MSLAKTGIKVLLLGGAGSGKTKAVDQLLGRFVKGKAYRATVATDVSVYLSDENNWYSIWEIPGTLDRVKTSPGDYDGVDLIVIVAGGNPSTSIAIGRNWLNEIPSMESVPVYDLANGDGNSLAEILI